MSNNLSFEGRIGKDAVIHGNGERKVISWTVASDEGWGDKKQTNWFQCKIWFDGKNEKATARAEKVLGVLKKGNAITVLRSSLTTSIYNDKTDLVATIQNMSDFTITRYKETSNNDAPAGDDAGGSDEIPF